MTIEYEENEDDKWSIATSEDVSIGTAMDQDCKECGACLQWTYDQDPTSLRISASCDDCELRYTISPTKAEITVSEDGL